MREITFTATCCDSGYGYESYYMKTVTGTGFKTVADEAYLLVNDEWLEVELGTVKISDSIK